MESSKTQVLGRAAHEAEIWRCHTLRELMKEMHKEKIHHTFCLLVKIKLWESDKDLSDHSNFQKMNMGLAASKRPFSHEA